MKQLWSCNLTELRTCKQKPYWRHHSSLRKIFLYCGRCQSKQLWCLISIWAGYRILNKCTQNIHFPTELRAIFKLLLKSIDLNDLRTSPKIHSTDTLTWLMDWLKNLHFRGNPYITEWCLQMDPQGIGRIQVQAHKLSSWWNVIILQIC